MTFAFDHAMCAVPTDRAGALGYEHLGFTAHFGGRHTVGTQNSVVPLEQGYLELLSVHDDAAARQSARHRLIAEYIDREAGGLIGFALRSDRIAEDAERLAASGLSFEGPVTAHRTRPDGEVLTWHVVRLTPQPCPAVVPMLVAGDQSAPHFTGHPNAITRCTGIALLTAEAGQLVKQYQTLLGIGSSAARERRDVGAQAVVLGLDGFEIEILEPAGPGLAETALERYGDSPFELSFAADRIDEVEAVTGLEARDGAVVVPAPMALGVRMVVRAG